MNFDAFKASTTSLDPAAKFNYHQHQQNQTMVLPRQIGFSKLGAA